MFYSDFIWWLCIYCSLGIVFEDAYAACDSATLEHLKELSAKRKAIEDSINATSFITEAIAKEMSGGLESRYEQDIHKIEQYLPLLENMFPYADAPSTNNRMAPCTAALKIRWSSALSTSCFFNFKGPKYFQIDDLRFELGMTLFLCGGILRERALEVLSTDLVQSATVFRQAAGIYHHLAQDVLPPLLHKLPSEKPPEALAAVSTIMGLICLAEAQAVTIRKAEEKGTSSSLLAKLHHGVILFLEEAIGIFHTVVRQCKDISLCLLESLAVQQVYEVGKRDQFLMKLRSKFEVVRAALLNRTPAPTLDVCLGELLREEQHLLTQGTMSHDIVVPDSISVAYSAQNKWKGCDMKQIQCFSYKQFGHIARNCNKKFCNYCKQRGHILL